jgi:tRNA 2-(methylsulfanyl)-N6-isopentenyladenosine37 hydroxylase
VKSPRRSASTAALVGSEASPLRAGTPAAWVDAAVERIPELLVDHANCEKKAASTALALIFAYPEDRALVIALSKLAREELKHFEQVDRLMHELEVPFVRMKPSRYATELRRPLSSREPQRKLDLLLVGALIEARSCERFDLLAEKLPPAVAGLYAGLRESEARHFEMYLRFAEREMPGDAWRPRLAELAALEAELATKPDHDFRFHSGPPLGAS